MKTKRLPTARTLQSGCAVSVKWIWRFITF